MKYNDGKKPSLGIRITSAKSSVADGFLAFVYATDKLSSAIPKASIKDLMTYGDTAKIYKNLSLSCLTSMIIYLIVLGCMMG